MVGLVQAVTYINHMQLLYSTFLRVYDPMNDECLQSNNEEQSKVANSVW